MEFCLKKQQDTSFIDFEVPNRVFPTGSDGFCKSFDYREEEEFKRFFEEYGFVVVDNVLDQNEVNETIQEIWFEIEDQLDHVDRNDPRTWDDWFDGSEKGFIGWDIPIMMQSMKNRQNERIYKVFSKLYGIEELWTVIDRYGVMRPTKNIPMVKLEEDFCRTSVECFKEEKTLVDKTNWKSYDRWLHWDLNPWKWLNNEGEEYSFDDFPTEFNGTKKSACPTGTKMQGLINLIEAREEDGGFLVVPGFHKHIKNWVEATKESGYAKSEEDNLMLVDVPYNSTLNLQAKKITAKAGSLIVWNSELPHCNFPNNSERFRMVHYLKMIPAQENGKGIASRIKMVQNLVRTINLSPLGRKLFGLQSWSDNTQNTEEESQPRKKRKLQM